MSARRSNSSRLPKVNLHDILLDGSITLWRNPAGQVFKDRDVWALTADWDKPSDIDDAYAKVLADEQALAREHAFAWDSDFGYLSPDPLHCGTALCFEAEFHLEGLHLVGDLPPTLNAIDAVRFQYAGIVEDGVTQAAHLFHVRNYATLGVSESDLKERARRLFSDLIEQEYSARKALVDETPRILADSVSRALAVLRSARLLAPGELLDLLSPVRLALTFGFLDGITRAEVTKLMQQQIDTPEIPPPENTEEERRIDARDAHLADRMNKRFANVQFTPLAYSHLL